MAHPTDREYPPKVQLPRRDEDRDACFRSLHRVYAIKDQMRIVPTHDHTASAAMLGSG
jgi:hypothetical protein